MLRAQFRPRYDNLFVAPKNANVEAARRRYFEGITNASEIMRISRRFSNVVACAPVLRGTLTARAGFENATIDLFGIDPALHLRTTDIGQQIIEGKFEDFRNNPSSVIVGSRLAEALGVGAGDTVQLLSPSGEYWRFTVAAVARSGVGSVDSTRVYCQSKIAQRLLHKPYPASMILYKLRDPDRAPELAQHFEQLFQHEARSWQDREEANLQLLLTLRVSTAITVALIILLAGFGIFNVLTMTVLSKIKEIAILRSIGYSRRDISAIFLWQGALIAALGSLLGCLIGAFRSSGFPTFRCVSEACFTRIIFRSLPIGTTICGLLFSLSSRYSSPVGCRRTARVCFRLSPPSEDRAYDERGLSSLRRHRALSR